MRLVTRGGLAEPRRITPGLVAPPATRGLRRGSGLGPGIDIWDERRLAGSLGGPQTDPALAVCSAHLVGSPAQPPRADCSNLIGSQDGVRVMLLVKNLLFTLVVPGAVAVYVPLLIVRGRNITSIALMSVAGAIELALGAAIYAWCVWDFGALGRGTPLPLDAPKRLVIRGLYRYTRNPMYLGVIIAALGWAALFGSAVLLGYAALVAIICHLFVVTYEEPKLHDLFGAEYDDYRTQVGRWLPSFSKKRAH